MVPVEENRLGRDPLSMVRPAGDGVNPLAALGVGPAALDSVDVRPEPPENGRWE